LSFFNELKRRNVLRIGIAYLIGSWFLIQVAETIFPLFGFDDSPARIIVIILAIGLVPALIFAWAFEMTPEGLKQEKDIDRTISTTPQTAKKLNRTITVVLALSLGYFVVDKFVLDPQRELALQQEQAELLAVATEEARKAGRSEALGGSANSNSIAVLPFANLSGDAANEPFTLGIHDDLLTHLSRIKALRTISRTSVLQYKGTTKTIPQIASELGVSSILEGGIQRSGTRVRINLQLIDAQTDEHLWAEVYDRELTAENLFAVQGEIATEVAKSLSATLLPEERLALEQTPTRSMAAYDLYLLGRHHLEMRTAESIGQARDYFSRAIEEDPDYVLAYSGLADAYTLLVSYGNLEGSVAVALAQEAIDKAMQLDDSVSEVWASQGVSLSIQIKHPEAAKALERAIELDPQNFSAWLWYANALISMRRFEEHIEALQTAYSLEPMSQPVNNNLAGAYSQRGDFVRSRQHYERVDQLNDLNPMRYKLQISANYFWSGDLSRSIADARQILATDPANQQAMQQLISAYVALGNIQEANVWVDRATAGDSITPFAIEVLQAQGGGEVAITYLEDKMEVLGDRRSMQFLFGLFQVAYLGGQIESAKSYLAEYVSHLGGRPEVDPSESFDWDWLLIADFWIKHGNKSAGEPRRGEELRDEVLASLTTLSSQGFEHPGTYYGLAMAKALQGDNIGALDALETSFEKGFINPGRLKSEPAFDSLRSESRYISILTDLQAVISRENKLLAETELAPYKAAALNEVVIVPRNILEKYVGYYSDGNAIMRFRLDDNGQFILRPAQQRDFVILASAEDEFYGKVLSSLTMKFVTDDAGVVTHMDLSNSGSPQRYKAVQPPPTAVVLETSVLKRYEGTYLTQRNKGSVDEGVDSDLWVAVVSVNSDGLG
jgi:TolB-like protein/Tfp pilus assembly protein PilF